MASMDIIVISIFCIFFASLCFVGNALVCHIIVQHKSLKTSMNVLLLNLAIVDCITGILGIYFIVIRDQASLFGTGKVLEAVYNRSSFAAESLCKVEASFWFSSAITPAFLVIIAYERYMAICHPLEWRRTEQTRKKYCFLPCWAFGIIFLVIKMLTIEYSDGRCKGTMPFWYNHKVYAGIMITLHFLLPFSLIFIAYYQVVKTLTSKSDLSMQPAVQKARSREKKTIVIVIITVTLIFLVCCGVPKTVYSLQVLFPVQFYNVDGNIPVLLFLINSASNPVIYFTFIKSFRKKLKISLKKLHKKSTKPPQSSNSFNAHSVVSLQTINQQLSVYVNIGCDSFIKSTPKLTKISSFHPR